MTIRPATTADAAAIAGIFEDIVAAGDTYPFESGTSPSAANYFLGPGITAFVAVVDDRVVGMYKLIPNQIGRGSHVSNASFMVDPQVRGRGVGRALGEHCLQEARRQGYKAMQFNFVVSTNAAAVALWKTLGFKIVGTLPKVFRHATLGDVDAFVMHRFL